MNEMNNTNVTNANEVGNPINNQINQTNNQTIASTNPTNPAPQAPSGPTPTTQTPSSTNNNEPPVENIKMKEQPITQKTQQPQKTPKGIFVVFILLIGFIFCLPYINEYEQHQKTKEQQEKLEQQLQNQEQQNQDEDNQTPKLTTTVCTKQAVDQGEYTLTEEQDINHKDDKIVSVDIRSTRVYKQEDEAYEMMKESCQAQADPLANPTHDGYSLDCEIDNLSITLTKSYDLELFESFTSGTGEVVTAPYEYNASLSETLKTLTTSGMTCQ